MTVVEEGMSENFFSGRSLARSNPEHVLEEVDHLCVGKTSLGGIRERVEVVLKRAEALIFLDVLYDLKSLWVLLYEHVAKARPFVLWR